VTLLLAPRPPVSRSPAASGAHRSDPRPRRQLLAGIALSYLGLGLAVTVSGLYLTDDLHFGVTTVAWCLSAAGTAAIPLAPLAGHVADRFGHAQTYAALLAVQALARVAMLAPHTRTAVGAALIVASAAVPATAASRASTIAAIGAGRRVAWAARGRAVGNLGYGLGAAIGGIALADATVSAYRLALAASALATGAAALATLGLVTTMRPGPAAGGLEAPWSTSRRGVLRDFRYLAATVCLGGILLLYNDILTWALPLWVARSTRAPVWVCSAALIGNTLMVAVFQVRASRRITGLRSAARWAAAASALMALACLLMLGAGRAPEAVAALAIAAAAALLTVGEIIQSASGIVVSYDLAPPDALGVYQGVFAAGYAGVSCISPILLGAALSHPHTGWPAVGLLMLAAGAPIPAITAGRPRPGPRQVPGTARPALRPEGIS
jgi:MFS family permease